MKITYTKHSLVAAAAAMTEFTAAVNGEKNMNFVYARCSLYTSIGQYKICLYTTVATENFQHESCAER